MGKFNYYEKSGAGTSIALQSLTDSLIRDTINTILPTIQMEDTERAEIVSFIRAITDNSLSYNGEALDKIIVAFLASSDILKVRLAAILETLSAKYKVARMVNTLEAIIQGYDKHTHRLLKLVHQLDQTDARVNEIKRQLEDMQHSGHNAQQIIDLVANSQ